MKKIASFITLLLVISSSFAQKTGDMFISGSIGISGGTDGMSYEYTYKGEIEGKYKGLSDEGISEYGIHDFNFSISPEFGYFIKNNCLLKIGLGYDLNRSLEDFAYWDEYKKPKNPVYKKYGKYWDSEDEEWTNEYAVPFYSFRNLFTITPAFHYYVAITENFYYTPGASLTLGFGSYKYQVAESRYSEKWEDEDYKDYENGWKKECRKEDTETAFRFGLNLHLLSFEFRPTQNIGISLNAGEFGYIYDSKYQNFNEKEMHEIYDEKNTTEKWAIYTNKINLNLNLNLKVGFSYYF